MKKFFALCAVLLITAGTVIKAQDRANEPDNLIVKSETKQTPDTTNLLVTTQPKNDTRIRSLGTSGSNLTINLKRLIPANLRPSLHNESDFLAPQSVADDAEESQGKVSRDHQTDQRFHWRPAIGQSLLFLAVQHGYAVTQPKTRRDLHGPFLKDYFRSVKSLHGWGDGGRFFTNYIAHPMEGSLTGFIQIQNDPVGIRQRFGTSSAYWRSRLKALAWSAAWSTQFEIGPLSQASIGNVGLHGKQTFVDLIITPTAGFGLLVVEDAIDKHIIQRAEHNTGNFYLKITSRMVLNPTRSIANLLRFQKPWYRDAGLR